MIKSMLANGDLLARRGNALTFRLQAFNLAQLRDDLFGRVLVTFIERAFLLLKGSR